MCHTVDAVTSRKLRTAGFLVRSGEMLRDEPRLWDSGTQSCDRGAEVRFVGIPELDDQRMPFERLLHDAALNSFAAAVDQTHLAQAGLVRRVDVVLDHRLDVAWQEGVQIEVRFDGNVVRHVPFVRWHDAL